MKKYLKWIFTVLAVLMMAFIFVMSSRSASDSTNESGGVCRLIGQIFWRDFEEWTPAEQLNFIKSINGAVRQSGHFFEFSLLGVLFHLTFSSWGVKPKIAFPVSAGSGVFYALTDEFHQLFVTGRSMEFKDVIYDSAGVLFGCLVVWLIVKASRKRRAKKGKAESA
ncbi:MAG: VanZ family protein [Clostridia bacterium]|nr:VanZ family protein [Clostridia bacterium]